MRACAFTAPTMASMGVFAHYNEEIKRARRRWLTAGSRVEQP